MQTPASERGNILFFHICTRLCSYRYEKKKKRNKIKSEGQGYREVIYVLDRVSGEIKSTKREKGGGSRGRKIFAADSAGEETSSDVNGAAAASG